MTRNEHHDPRDNNNESFNLSYHLEMLNDNERVKKIKEAIDLHINRNSIVCEFGCGTGIFSVYAAKKCKKVYAIEYDENVIKIAKQNAKNNAVLDKITFIHADASVVEIPEKVDLIVCEMMSVWLINEPQVDVMNNALKYLNENGKVIPEKIINLVEIANTDYVFDGIEIRTSIAQFSGIKQARISTESKVVNSINLYENNPREIKKSIKMQAITTETLNCVRLSSIVQFAPRINFYSTDTLMPVTTVPLKEDVDVEAGENITLNIEYEHRGSIDEAIFTVSK